MLILHQPGKQYISENYFVGITFLPAAFYILFRDFFLLTVKINLCYLRFTRFCPADSNQQTLKKSVFRPAFAVKTKTALFDMKEIASSSPKIDFSNESMNFHGSARDFCMSGLTFSRFVFVFNSTGFEFCTIGLAFDTTGLAFSMIGLAFSSTGLIFDMTGF